MKTSEIFRVTNREIMDRGMDETPKRIHLIDSNDMDWGYVDRGRSTTSAVREGKTISHMCLLLQVTGYLYWWDNFRSDKSRCDNWGEDQVDVWGSTESSFTGTSPSIAATITECHSDINSFVVTQMSLSLTMAE